MAFSGFPSCSGYISPYIPPLIIIQIHVSSCPSETVLGRTCLFLSVRDSFRSGMFVLVRPRQFWVGHVCSCLSVLGRKTEDRQWDPRKDCAVIRNTPGPSHRPSIPHCTVHCTLYNVQCDVHCELYTVLYTVQCNVHSTLYTTEHCKMYNVHSTRHTRSSYHRKTFLPFLHSLLHTAHCTLHTAHCTLKSAHSTLVPTLAGRPRVVGVAWDLAVPGIGPRLRMSLTLGQTTDRGTELHRTVWPNTELHRTVLNNTELYRPV